MRFARSAKFTKIFEKISVSQSTRNALKRIEMQKKKNFTLLTEYARKARVAKRNLTYPMSPAGSQGVSMPNFMRIGLKLWALEGYRQTNKQTNRQSYFNYIDEENMSL